MIFQQLGPSVFLTVAQTVFLTNLLPRLREIKPEITAKQVLDAGETGLKGLVTESELPKVLVEYVTSLDKVFQIAASLAAFAVVLVLFLKWGSIRKKKREVPKE